MNKIFIISIQILILILFSTCEDRPRNNPFDPETDLAPEDWAPSNLQAQVLNDSQIKLTWTQEITPVSGFRLERLHGGGFILQIAEVDEDITEYTDTGLTLETDYTYRVRAFTDENESEYTNTVEMTLFYDCTGLFMGNAVEDCAGECNGTAIEDCAGKCNGTAVEDIDDNCYETVQIGNQVWMAENLKVTHYRDGTAIPTGHNYSDWSNLTTGAYAVYDNNESNADTYGYLYNWYAAVDSRNIAPEGWHVPTDAEWTILTDYLGGESVAGGKLKEAGTSHWNSPNTEATNESGFTALPGGYCSNEGNYFDMGYAGYFWSSTWSGSGNAWCRKLYYYYSAVYRNGYDKRVGFSVRCVRTVE